MTRFTTPRLALPLAVLVLALLTAGCGGEDGDDVAAADPPATTMPADPTTAPVDPTTVPADSAGGPTSSVIETLAGLDEDAVVLRLASGGGFVPMEVASAEVPALIVMGDGRVLRTAASAEQMPAIRAIDELRLDPEGMAALIEAARAAGLLETGATDYGNPPVTDLPTTSLTITLPSATFEHQAYALGFEDASVDGLTDAQRAHRHALQAFLTQLDDLEAIAGEHLQPVGPYAPEHVALQRIDGAGVVGQRRPWPAEAVDPPPANGCAEVSGDAATAAAEALAKAGADTSWTLSGVEFRAVGRAILPGEAGCAT